jgi:hypothetical protein
MMERCRRLEKRKLAKARQGKDVLFRRMHFLLFLWLLVPRCRVAGWHICIPKISIWVFYTLPFGIFCGHLVYFVVIWYIFWPFGIICGYLVYFMAIWYISSRFGML